MCTSVHGAKPGECSSYHILHDNYRYFQHLSRAPGDSDVRSRRMLAAAAALNPHRNDPAALMAKDYSKAPPTAAAREAAADGEGTAGERHATTDLSTSGPSPLATADGRGAEALSPCLDRNSDLEGQESYVALAAAQQASRFVASLAAVADHKSAVGPETQDRPVELDGAVLIETPRFSTAVASEQSGGDVAGPGAGADVHRAPISRQQTQGMEPAGGAACTAGTLCPVSGG